MTKEVSITEGPIGRNYFRFLIPIILSNLLQISFNTVDLAIVGLYCGSDAVASVGATSSLVHLLLNLFIGLATGTTIAVSRSVGAKDYQAVSEYVHTAVAIALSAGVFIGTVGFIIARPAFIALNIPEGPILDGACLYFKIYFIGAPALLIYNFGAGILKANGDAQYPFLCLTIGGIINVILNIILVTMFNMSVDGVAIATVASNVVAACMVFVRLINYDGCSRLIIREIKVHKEGLVKLIKYGIPVGIQSSMFSIPNLMIQGSVNTFGAAAIAGNAAATSVGSYFDSFQNSFADATLTFVAQNNSAGFYERTKKVFRASVLSSAATTFVLGIVVFAFGRAVLSVFIAGNELALHYGMVRMLFCILPNCIASFMQVSTATLRGFGNTFYPMVVTIIGTCFARILWMLFVYPFFGTIECIYFTYPFTWVITIIPLLIKISKTFKENKPENKLINEGVVK